MKVRYQEPRREIIRDLDGTLTGLGPNSWTTPYWKHNDKPGCQRKDLEYDGLICNSSVQIRRIVFYNYAPHAFVMRDMKILPFDDSIVGSMNNVTKKAYIDNKDNYSIVPFREDSDPSNAWAMPYITGYKYKIHWF